MPPVCLRVASPELLLPMRPPLPAIHNRFPRPSLPLPAVRVVCCVLVLPTLTPSLA